MALSVVNFRLNQGKEWSQISFNGNGIKLLDLKREVLEIKKMSLSMDFDLRVVDDNDKEYVEDDEIVPKNASVIVKRIPAKNANTSLMVRLSRGGFSNNLGISQQKADINVPIKSEPVATMDDEASSNVPKVVEAVKQVEDEPIVLKRTQPVVSLAQASQWEPSGAGGGGFGFGQNIAAGRGGGRGGFAGTAGSVGGRGSGPMMNTSSYLCSRCGKAGHSIKICPTLGDPKYDAELRLMNVPKNSRRKVSSLTGVDVTNKTVVENKDGSFEIFETSQSGLAKLTQSESSSGNTIDMAEVPGHLKCAITSEFLREAVTLPCCKKSVNDSAIRQLLIESSLQCPLCNTPSVSPDSLMIRADLRNAVDSYLKNKGVDPLTYGGTALAPSQQQSLGSGADVTMSGLLPADTAIVTSGFDVRPPLPMSHLPVPMGVGILPPPVAGATARPPPPPGAPPPAVIAPAVVLQSQDTVSGGGGMMGYVMPPPLLQTQIPIVLDAAGLATTSAAAPPIAGPAVVLVNPAHMMIPQQPTFIQAQPQQAQSALPPIEALPKPLLREEFFAEQALQREQKLQWKINRQQQSQQMLQQQHRQQQQQNYNRGGPNMSGRGGRGGDYFNPQQQQQRSQGWVRGGGGGRGNGRFNNDGRGDFGNQSSYYNDSQRGEWDSRQQQKYSRSNEYGGDGYSNTSGRGRTAGSSRDDDRGEKEDGRHEQRKHRRRSNSRSRSRSSSVASARSRSREGRSRRKDEKSAGGGGSSSSSSRRNDDNEGSSSRRRDKEETSSSRYDSGGHTKDKQPSGDRDYSDKHKRSGGGGRDDDRKRDHYVANGSSSRSSVVSSSRRERERSDDREDGGGGGGGVTTTSSTSSSHRERSGNKQSDSTSATASHSRGGADYREDARNGSSKPRGGGGSGGGGVEAVRDDGPSKDRGRERERADNSSKEHRDGNRDKGTSKSSGGRDRDGNSREGRDREKGDVGRDREKDRDRDREKDKDRDREKDRDRDREKDRDRDREKDRDRGSGRSRDGPADSGSNNGNTTHRVNYLKEERNESAKDSSGRSNRPYGRDGARAEAQLSFKSTSENAASSSSGHKRPRGEVDDYYNNGGSGDGSSKHRNIDSDSRAGNGSGVQKVVFQDATAMMALKSGRSKGKK